MLEHAAMANIFDDTFDELPIPLHSSNLCHVTYDSTLKELDVHFVNGSTYTYFDVPRYIVRNLLLAPSAGHYFTRRIRNKYVYAKEGE